jgi:hypothetical protein
MATLAERAAAKRAKLAYQEIELREKYQRKLRERMERTRMRKAEAAEECGVGLQYPGIVPSTGRRSETLQQELESAIFWSRLLDIGITDGTLADCCRQIYDEFTRQGCWMWNPYSQSFSQEWKFVPTGETFQTGWTLIPGSDAFQLNPADFSDSNMSSESQPVASQPSETEKPIAADQ